MMRVAVRILLAMIAVLAVGLGTLVNPSPIAVTCTEGFALLCLSVGLVGAIARPAPRGGWQGFAVFGWVYFMIANSYFPRTIIGGDMGSGQIIPPYAFAAWRLPSATLVDALIVLLHPQTRPPEIPSFATNRTPIRLLETGEDGLFWETAPGQTGTATPVPLSKQESDEWISYESRRNGYQMSIFTLVFGRRIAHAQLGLAIGLFGAIVGHYLGRARPIRPESLPSSIPPIEQR
jgi:hypothetical protein